MICIRYTDFSAGAHDLAGRHGRAERRARAVTVYLLPGLTGRQRRAVIRRLRQEANRGFGPPLPLPQLAVALGLDRVRTAARIVTSSVRLHPAVTLLPSAFVVAMITLFVIASGGRPGIASGTHGELADAAAASGSTAKAVSAEHLRVRVTRAGAAEGSGGGVDGGCPGGSLPVVVAAGQGAYIWPRAAAFALWPQRDGYLACHRPAPHTAHLHGSLGFAW